MTERVKNPLYPAIMDRCAALGWTMAYFGKAMGYKFPRQQVHQLRYGRMTMRTRRKVEHVLGVRFEMISPPRYRWVESTSGQAD